MDFAAFGALESRLVNLHIFCIVRQLFLTKIAYLRNEIGEEILILNQSTDSRDVRFLIFELSNWIILTSFFGIMENVGYSKYSS